MRRRSMASCRAINRLSGTVFYAEFPGYDPFPDPSSLVSPFTLKRDDKNATVALSDTHIFGSSMVNEIRGGMFYLDNTRQLDDPFLDITNASVGIPNPANNYDTSNATTRLGHYVGRPGGTMERFSFGGPNDSFNKREQRTWTIGNTLTWSTTSHALRMGGEFRRNEFNTNLPEEQATEFEKFDNFTMFLRGLGNGGGHAVRDHRQAVPLQRLQSVPRRRLAARTRADDQCRRPLRVFRSAGRSRRPHRQRGFRGDHEYRKPGERLHRAG